MSEEKLAQTTEMRLMADFLWRRPSGAASVQRICEVFGASPPDPCWPSLRGRLT